MIAAPESTVLITKVELEMDCAVHATTWRANFAIETATNTTIVCGVLLRREQGALRVWFPHERGTDLIPAADQREIARKFKNAVRYLERA
jgi:hypothetical protein